MNRPPRDRREAGERRRGHRHLGHHRVAPRESPQHQRPRRDARHLLSRLPRQRRDGRAASGAQGDEPAGADGATPGWATTSSIRAPSASRTASSGCTGRESKMAGTGPLQIARWDTYDWYRSFPTLDSLARATGAQQVAHLAALRRSIRPTTPSGSSARCSATCVTPTIPTLTVGGWWDQEDGFGPLASYAALERSDTAGVQPLVSAPGSTASGTTRPATHLAPSVSAAPPARTSARCRRASSPATSRTATGGPLPEATVFDAGTNSGASSTTGRQPDAAQKSLYFRDRRARCRSTPPTAAAGSDTLRLRSRASRALPAAPDPVIRGMGRVAGARPALRRGPARRADLADRAARRPT